jgi:hypothetical protein
MRGGSSVWSLLMSSLHSGRQPSALKEALRAASDTFPPGASATAGVDTARLQDALRSFDASELCLPEIADNLNAPSSPDACRAVSKRPAIRYLSLVDQPEFSMGIFLLPRHARIPPHDHIGMTVVSKLLYGTMEVSSYDLLDDPAAAQDEGKRGQAGAMHARARADSLFCVLTTGAAPPRALPNRARAAGSRVEHVATRLLTGPSEVTVLTPTYANVHEVLACTDCAMLDVIGPPYEEEAEPERRCQYYALGGGALPGGAAETRIEPIDQPNDFRCKGLNVRAINARVAQLLEEIASESAGAGPSGVQEEPGPEATGTSWLQRLRPRKNLD